MGGTSTSVQAPPPPAVDYSAAMAYASDNNKTIAMGQIMAQQFAMQQASMDRQMQTAANLELGIEKLDTKLQIAKLNYIQSMTEEEDRHVEKMAEIGGDIDAARAETAAANTVDLTNFLNDGDGSYTPGEIWNGASGYANSNRVDFNEQMNGLRDQDAAQHADNVDMMNNHIENRTEQLENAANHASYDAYVATFEATFGQPQPKTYEEWSSSSS